MRAGARVEVARRGGRDVLVDARSEPPVTVRRTPDRILLVGSAAGPVGGDDLTVGVVVGPGARAAVGTAAASVVWPGPGGAEASTSTSTTAITVGDGGHLDWRPEPIVSVVGSRHVARTTVRLHGTATAFVVEEISLGRTGEPSGRIDVELRVERDGVALVHHAETLGPGVPGWGSAVHVGAARHVVTAVTVGRPAPPPSTLVGPTDRAGDGRGDAPDDGVTVAVLPVAPDVTVTLVVAPDRPSAHRFGPRWGA